MPKQNRNTLKSFFSDGAMPTSDMFEDFIDSTININDDGFEKTDVDGLKLSNMGDYQTLLSFYDQKDRDNAEWTVRLDGSGQNFVLGCPVPENAHPQDDSVDSTAFTNQFSYALNLDKSQQGLRLGLGKKSPKDALDVTGNLRSEGRRGSFGHSFQSVVPNGDWISITPPLQGGVVLEVVARAMNREKMYYGLMHAIAMHSPWRAKRDISYFLGLKNKIRYTHAYYDSMLHRMKLRWTRIAGEQGYRLQIRSNCNYGDAGVMDFHITCQWSDDDEFEALTTDQPAGGGA